MVSKVPIRGMVGLIAAFIVVGCTEKKPTAQPHVGPKTALDVLSADAAAILRHAPGVAEVKRHGPDENPTHRIIHLADWHFVDRDSYAADLRSLSAGPLSDAEIDKQFAELLDEVGQVQEQQMAVLRWLIKHHGLKQVHIEGLTESSQPVFEAKIEALRTVGKRLADLRSENEELLSSNKENSEAKEVLDKIEQLDAEYLRDTLELGAAGRLVLLGELEGLLPLEDEEAYLAANPVSKDGTVKFDKANIEVREDAQVRRLLDNGPFAIIILGGGHDLSENVKRLSNGKAEYLRVEVEAWKAGAGST